MAAADPSGGMLKFFEGGPDAVVQRCLAVPELRDYVADAAFVKSLRAVAAKAAAAKTPEAVGAVTRDLMLDPRLTQCAMLGTGVRLKVEDEDLKRAERTGDIAKRSPLRVDDLVAASRFSSAAEAKDAGTAAYNEGDVPRALAFWCRSIAVNRERGEPDDRDVAAVAYSNVSQGLYKLGYFVRAEQAATRALAYLEAPVETDVFAPPRPSSSSELRRKTYYRRAVAREKRKRYAEALRDAKEVDDEALVSRLEKLLAHERALEKAREARKREEKDRGEARAAGLELSSREQRHASLGYLAERDYSAIFLKSLAVAEVSVPLSADGAVVELVSVLAEQSKVDVSVTTKRGHEALYYDIDLVCAWRASPPPVFDLSPSSSDEDVRPVEGTVRLYNVSHETKYEPGADPNVAYMYQLGYRGIPPAWFDGTASTDAAPPAAKLLIDGAHHLYEALATHVDATLAHLKAKLDHPPR